MKQLSQHQPLHQVLKLSKHLISWFFILILFILVLYPKDPLLLAYRTYETTIIIVSTLLLIFPFQKTNKTHQLMAYCCLTCIFILAIFNEVSFYYRKHLVLHSQSMLGEHFIVGYSGSEFLKPLIIKGLIGGLFITKHNVADKTAIMIKKEIDELQQIRKQAGLPPLIVATDQEGGIVSRMTPPLPRQPALSSIISPKLTLEQLATQAKKYGQQQGLSLAQLGINVNFSPVVDLKPNRPTNKLDFHTLIKQRAISADPVITAKIALAYGEGLRNSGVTPTFKHFPGLARVTQDTHYFTAILNTPVAELEQHDWLPYREIVKQPSNLIMLSHVTLASVDKNHPVSFSQKVVQGILRDKWQYNGILITDDLTMRAAYSHGICQASIAALNAGVDLLLISFDEEKYYEAMYCVEKAYTDGAVEEKTLELSHQRLKNFFTHLGKI